MIETSEKWISVSAPMGQGFRPRKVFVELPIPRFLKHRKIFSGCQPHYYPAAGVQAWHAIGELRFLLNGEIVGRDIISGSSVQDPTEVVYPITGTLENGETLRIEQATNLVLAYSQTRPLPLREFIIEADLLSVYVDRYTNGSSTDDYLFYIGVRCQSSLE